MSTSILILTIVILVIIAAIAIVVTLFMINKKTKDKLNKELSLLEKNKNELISSTIITELNKVKSFINNEKLEHDYKKWNETFDNIKNKRISKITDLLLDIETLIETRKFKEAYYQVALTELEILYIKHDVENLLESIRNITMSEERNRQAITKLKVTYRETMTKFNKNKDEYKGVIKPIELQFENINKLFGAFELAMEKNEYEEVSKIVKALDDLINNIKVVIEEAPTILLLGKVVIPKKISDVKSAYNKMKKNGYNLEYINLDYNVEESEKNLSDIIDKLKVLNLEDSVFELKTMLDYFESLFNDFEKEKKSKKSYEESIESIKEKISRISTIIKNIYAELQELRDSYDLTEEEVGIVDTLHKDLVGIKDDFKLISDRTKTKITPYSRLNRECELMNVRVAKLDDKLEAALNNLGSLKEDEARARDQLQEIRGLLRDAKNKMKEYKLPVIPKKYYVELEEAAEAIKEITKELDKKPISISVLNTRVDTARDLVLKLYNTSKTTSKTSSMAEMAIVYANRYRSTIKEVEEGIIKSEKEFFKGDYKTSLETILNALNIVEPGIHNKLLSAYEE